MRILALGNLYPPAASGGYERIWASAMRAARADGHDVRVLTTAPVPGREVPEGLHEPGVHRELRWYWREHDWWTPPLRERRAIERHNAGVLDGHLAEFAPHVASVWGMGGMSLALLERLARAGVPAVGVVADAWMIYGPRADRGLHVREPRWRTAARWLFISAALRDACGIDGELVHPGVDPAQFPPAPAIGWAWRLACVGRLEPGKGIETAIEALARLPQATLTLDGDGSPRHAASLRALAEDLGVARRVRFQRSPSDRVHAAYAGADAILFPVTWPEPWGLVPLEAMSVGRPVLATGTGGSGEYLRDGENALLHDPGDAAALADAVGRLAEDAALRSRLVAGGAVTAARYTAAAFDSAVLGALQERAGVLSSAAHDVDRGA